MSKVCRKCQTTLEDDYQFCTRCGIVQDSETTNITGFIPTIEIERESCFVGCILTFSVFVDGKKIGQLKNGEKKRFQLKPGLHEVYIKANWLYSPKVTFALNDLVKLSCKPQVGIIGSVFGKLPFYLLFKRHKFVALKQI